MSYRAFTQKNLPVPENKFESESSSTSRILVCLGRSCRKYGSEKVFANFQANLPTEVELVSVMCFGQCGNGAMVLVEPEQTWYWQVHPDEVAVVIKQHLVGKKPVKEMLYPKFHRQK